MKCAVANCNNFQKTKGMGFHCFPKDELLLRQWVHFCRQSVNPKVARICSEHFLPEDFERSLQVEMGKKLVFAYKSIDNNDIAGFSKFKGVKSGAVPTVKSNKASTSDASRRSRVLKRSNKKMVTDLLKNQQENISPNVSYSTANVQDEIPIPDFSTSEDIIKQQEQEIEGLKLENVRLRESSANQLDKGPYYELHSIFDCGRKC
ncbi:PREDICTED: uncharacterized protein LOC108371860 [Rhagoletis zephyria]|uniref:uncharacterized protein LOC108371860 n=1 Tax=Rhagoletis zephyria TaxID=28612 RepID=UPI0008117661|nr:PREDICTED: uncharacterized protein LOC108371860 [Rhagoletis zephyria]